MLPGILQEFPGGLTCSEGAELSEGCAVPWVCSGGWRVMGTVAWGELERGQQLQFWLLAWERCLGEVQDTEK